MHRRLGALLGVIAFVLVAGYWALAGVNAILEGGAREDLPSPAGVLLRALGAMVLFFVLGWMLSRHGMRLLEEARERAEAASMGLEPPEEPAPPAPEGDETE